jgi:hypothetical protein
MQELIVDFMHGFYGYGKLAGRYWLIGLEEGCGPDWETDIAPRFVQWNARGRRKIEDVRDYHAAIGITRHWVAPVKVQRTWRRLIETVWAANHGAAPSKEDIQDYQMKRLGMAEDETCIMELLPLPSRNVGQFPYIHLANEEYPFFGTRELYREHIMDTRIAYIRRLIAEKKEGHVILYGYTRRDAWDSLIAPAQWEQMHEYIERCQINKVYVWLVPHPTAWRIPGDLFITLGKMIRSTDEGASNRD